MTDVEWSSVNAAAVVLAQARFWVELAGGDPARVVFVDPSEPVAAAVARVGDGVGAVFVDGETRLIEVRPLINHD